MSVQPPAREFEEALSPAAGLPLAATELASALWRRRGTILVCGLLALALAAAALARLPDRFAAQAEILLETPAPRLVELDRAPLAEPLDKQAVQSEIRLVQSQQLLARVARKLRLAEDPEFGADRGPGRLAPIKDALRAFAVANLGWTPPPPTPPPTARQAELRAVAHLRRNLDVVQQDASRVLAVRVTAGSAEKAALLANAVADQYIVDRLEAKLSASSRAVDWLGERLDGLAERLETAETAAEAQRARLAADPTAGLSAVRRRLAELAAALAPLEADAAADPDGPAAARARALRASIAALEAEAETRSAGEIRLRQLEREAEAAAVLHGAVLARLRETDAQLGLEHPDARLIAEAAPPLGPVAPNAPATLAFATVAGLALGAALAFARESAGGVHHSADAAERETGLPVLAALPRADRRADDPVEAVRCRPGSRLAEAVRELRAAALSGADGPVVVAVVSAGPGEGKSTVAAMLAESCARLGRRTVLVDGDARDPSQARRYGLSAAEDLVALLEGEATLDEVIWTHEELRLSVLPAQATPALRAEALAGPALDAALDALRARFDVIVIDTPPLLAVADGRRLAAAADRTILALRWGETLREDARGAVRTLADAGARGGGLALVATPRRADPRPGRASGGGRYGRFRDYFEE